MLDANSKLFRPLACVSPKTRKFLNFTAFLNPNRITLTFIWQASCLKIDPNKALSECMKQRIATISGPGINIDPELLEHLRDKLSFAESQTYLGHVINALLNRFSETFPDNPNQWPSLEFLVPHVISACNYGEQFDLNPAAIGWLLNQAGLLLILSQQYPPAEHLFKKAIQLARDGKDPELLTRLSNFARLRHAQNQIEEAKTLIDEALNLTKTPNPNLARGAYQLRNLALVLTLMDRKEEAQTLYQQADQIDQPGK